MHQPLRQHGHLPQGVRVISYYKPDKKSQPLVKSKNRGRIYLYLWVVTPTSVTIDLYTSSTNVCVIPVLPVWPESGESGLDRVGDGVPTPRFFRLLLRQLRQKMKRRKNGKMLEDSMAAFYSPTNKLSPTSHKTTLFEYHYLNFAVRLELAVLHLNRKHMEIHQNITVPTNGQHQAMSYQK